MSLVIGVNTPGAVVFGCDGFGLIENKKTKTVKKLYTQTKLAVFRPWNIVVGYVGETEALVNIVAPMVPSSSLKELKNGNLDVASTPNLTEEEFLSNIAYEIRRVHQNTEKTHIVLVCGYCDQHMRPVQFLFDRKGRRTEIKEFVCIGSGGEIASRIIGKSYTPQLTLDSACRLVIKAIYAASVVPTVNSLPMIVIVCSDAVHDLTTTTKEEYNRFRGALRDMLIRKALSVAN